MFSAQVHENAPMKVDDIKRANKYIERSFNNHNDIDIISDFDNIVRYSINLAITLCVTWNDREKVASILRFYQPTFPENCLCHCFNTEKDRVENAIKELYSGNVNDIFALLKDEKILLNFFSTNFSGNRKETSEDYEIEAFLIPNEKFNGLDHSYYSESFASNNYPHANLEDFEDDVIPLITNNDSFSSLIIGSDIVPSFTTKNISNYLSDEMCSKIESTNWRQGRHWGQNRHGTSQKAGYSITIPQKDIVSLSKEYKLVWQIYHKHETKYLDVFGQKEIT